MGWLTTGEGARGLERLVKKMRLSKTAPIPCIVRDPALEVSAEEDSLAENVHRVALHPLDQFRTFKALRDQSAGDEEIAARFFVPPAVVKQRLRLASVSEFGFEIAQSTVADYMAMNG